MNVLNPGERHGYVLFGAGYSSSPHTKGKGKSDDPGYSFGYFSSFFVNPGIGMEFPLGRTTYYFTELNYYIHQWTSTTNNFPGYEPRKFAHVLTLTIGIKL